MVKVNFVRDLLLLWKYILLGLIFVFIVVYSFFLDIIFIFKFLEVYKVYIVRLF